MAIALFKYTDDEWTEIAKHLRPGDDAAAVRAALQVTGLRYKLDVAANDIRDRRLRQKRRQETLKRARAFLAYLEAVPADEKHGLQRPLVIIKAWIESDDMRLIEKRANAEKPAQNFVVEKVLQVWREKLGREIPKSGGNPTGPLARFVIDAASPIVQPDKITGDDARYLIREVEKRRA